MSLCVLHVNSSSPDSTSPTMRIARYVADQIPDASFVYDVETAEHFNATYDVVFVKYGLLAFSEHRKLAVEILNKAKRVINLENDYSFTQDKRLRAPDEVWSTVAGRTRYCNWNVLTRHGTKGWIDSDGDLPITPYIRTEHDEMKMGLIYYGAYRPDRVGYFEKYFRHAPYPVTISSYRGERNFGVLCPNANLMSAFRDPDGPAKWEMTVYLEDTASHNLYCSPANRFYECLHMGLPQAIDELATATLTQAGIPCVRNFQVNSKMELRALMQDSYDVAMEQQGLWRRDYAADLHEQFDSAMKESGLR